MHIEGVPAVLDDVADDAHDVHGARCKRYEDAIDALICGWVGMRNLEGDAVDHGDGAAALRRPSAPKACVALSTSVVPLTELPRVTPDAIVSAAAPALRDPGRSPPVVDHGSPSDGPVAGDQDR
jgi:hypothetical protein